MNSHFINCSVCGQDIDCRDLSQVFAHEPCDGNHKDYNTVEQIPHNGSQKIGEPIFYAKNKLEINLN